MQILTMKDTWQLAQTYPQLINQLLARGETEANLQALKSAFDLAQAFSDGIYRAQGVPLINHLVRTASILVEEDQPMPVIIAGLLHAGCLLHKFDHSSRSQLIAKPLSVMFRQLGAEVTRLVAHYPDLHWYNPAALTTHIENVQRMDEGTRQLVIIQLANELEDNLDLAICYSAEQRQHLRLNSYYDECITLAKALELDFIARHLEIIKQLQLSANIPSFLQRPYKQSYEMPNKRMWQMSFIEKAKRGVKLLLHNLR
jgi:(p)ppGpp synthase/HD superfamily hydrolase